MANGLNQTHHTSGLPLNEIALAIGDAAHNYRSALDHLWYQIVITCGGTPHAQTSFPIRNAADSLKAAINGALKEQQITAQVFDGIMSLKPYKAGNPVICGLHNLNIWDKHEMPVPVLQLMAVLDVCFEDDQGSLTGRHNYYLDQSSRVRIREFDDRKITVKDKGHAAIQILFNIGAPFEGEAVIPTFIRISEAVIYIIEFFERFSFE
jgi:hypothetical protein